MNIRGVAIRFAAFAVVSILLLVLLVNTMLDGLPGKSRDFHAEFTDVSGLRVGDDVRVAGVRVGRVASIKVSGRDGAEVTFQLQDTQPILATTDVVMRYQNLVGQRYLALVQGTDQGTELKAGAMIPVERTDPGFDLTELLNGFRPLFDVLQPEDVNKLSTSIVQVLQGEGGTVESLLQQTARLTQFLADRDDVIDAVITRLTPVLTNLGNQDKEFTATVSQLRELMTGLADDRASIGHSIDGVSELIGATSDLLTQARQPTRAAVKQFVTVARMLDDNRDELVAALRSFGATMSGLARPTSYESALNIYICSFALGIGPAEVNLAGNNGPWSEACR